MLGYHHIYQLPHHKKKTWMMMQSITFPSGSSTARQNHCDLPPMLHPRFYLKVGSPQIIMFQYVPIPKGYVWCTSPCSYHPILEILEIMPFVWSCIYIYIHSHAYICTYTYPSNSFHCGTRCPAQAFQFDQRNWRHPAGCPSATAPGRCPVGSSPDCLLHPWKMWKMGEQLVKTGWNI